MKKLYQIIIAIGIMIIPYAINAQTWNTAGNALVGNEILGSTNGFPLNLYTNNNQRATILSSGLFGIGLNFTPNHKLDVDTGSINVNKADSSYMINSQPVLWHKGVTSNIFVGVGTGTGGSNNTYVGNQAGASNGSSSNTFIGCMAGKTGNGTSNTYIGTSCGLGNLGSYNTICGYNAGATTSSGTNQYNSFFGYDAALSFKTGQKNCFFGQFSALQMVRGDSNIFIGAGVQNSTDTIRNSIVIGTNALVRANNKMILGDSMIYVGIGLSNDATGPQKPLEIKARNSSGVAVSDASGLRFRQLTSSSPTTTWNGKVLTVDGSGDVVLVKDSIGSGGGGGGNVSACSAAAANYVTKFTTIGSPDTICNSIIYDDGTHVGISTASPTSKLTVSGDVDVTGDSATAYRLGGTPWMWTHGSGNVFLGPAGNRLPGTENTFIGNNSGLANNGTGGGGNGCDNTFVGGSAGTSNTSGQNNTFLGKNAGFYNTQGSNNVSIGTHAGESDSSSKNVMIGHYAGQQTHGTGNSYNVFVGESAGSYNTTGTNNTIIGGLTGTVNSRSGSYNTLLGYGTNFGNDGLTNAAAIGYSARIDSSNAISLGSTGIATRVLIGYTGTPVDSNELLFVNGGGYFAGNCHSTGWFSISDAKVKTNIEDLTDANAVLDRINPKSYAFNQSAYPALHLPSGSHYGVIAEEVQNVIPSAVELINTPTTSDSSGNLTVPSTSLMTVNYQEFIPLLIASNKQQRQAISDLQTQLAQLQATVAGCCASGNPGARMAAPSNVTSVDLHNAILLEQNSPNPFAEHTTINYNVGSEIQNAKIIFFDNLGRILKSIVISERGPGMLDVYAGDLSSGMYSYSLIGDGQVLDTKKMVKMK